MIIKMKEEKKQVTQKKKIISAKNYLLYLPEHKIRML
jgi:hypothetical protein